MSLLPAARSFDPNKQTAPTPEGYVAGTGRGASPFSTRADLGSAPVFVRNNVRLQTPLGPLPPAGGGARPKSSDPFGAPPVGYVAGRGRGATGFSGGVSRDDQTEQVDRGDYSETNYDPFTGYSENLFNDAEYDAEDEKADAVYDAIDRRVDTRRKSRRDARLTEELARVRAEKPTIHNQFADLKRDLAAVSREEWEAIPEIGDYSLKQKQRKLTNYTPITDRMLLAAKGTLAQTTDLDPRVQNGDGTATPLQSLAGTATPIGLTGGFATPMGFETPMGLQTPLGGITGSTSSLNDLGEARGTILSVKLDKVMDNVSGQSVIDPKGYLTDLNSQKIKSEAELADFKKRRLLLKSLLQTNPNHAAGWIAAARIEESAGKLQQSRELIAEGCHHCPKNESVWLEAARLDTPDRAKAVIAKGLEELPKSVRLWLDAAERESEKDKKVLVLRKALQSNPSSVRLWMEAVKFEDEVGAKILLSKAVELVPSSIEMWLALADRCPYQEAQKVLNEARKNVPTAVEVWIAAAKLEESKGNVSSVEAIISRGMHVLAGKGAALERESWLQLAESSEKSGFLAVCRAIIKVSLTLNLEEAFQKRTWKEDARQFIVSGCIEAARSILECAVEVLKNKKSLWLALADLETKHGTSEKLNNVLQRSVEACPDAEVLWLMAAKQRWLDGDVDGARTLLHQAFEHHHDKDGLESISLAAAKLERETGNFDRAEAILARTRDKCNSPKVWMQSVQLQRQLGRYDISSELCIQAKNLHPTFAKLWMISGQMELEKTPPDAAKASEEFREGITKCPKSAPLHICSVKAEISQQNWVIARALLEKARLKLPGTPLLWYATVELEKAAAAAGSGSENVMMHCLSKGLQECPTSGILWALAIELEPKATQNAKAVDALNKCENDAHVILCVACLFWRDGKALKSRKWFARAVALNPALGDCWASHVAFELVHGNELRVEDVLKRATAASPTRGLKWNRIAKSVANWGTSVRHKIRKYIEEYYPQSLTQAAANNIVWS